MTSMTACEPHSDLSEVFVPPGAAYLEGHWTSGPWTLDVTDPETGRVVDVVCEAGAAEADRAVTYLAREYPRSSWPLWARREALATAARLVVERAPELAEVIASESSKTIREARSEVRRAAETLRLSGEAASTLEGRTVPFDNSERGAGWVGWFTREPVGIVAAITPYNDPLNLVAHKLGPALLAGNAVVLKPSELTPLSAFALAGILLEAGVPGSHLAVLTGLEAARALVADDRVDVVSFTGGRRTADKIAGQGRARKLLMELGGNNALIAFADADPAEVAAAIVDGAFGVAGQNCLSVQRALIAEPLYDEVLDRVVALASALRVGTKSDPATDLGPMITEEAAVEVIHRVAAAVKDGAVLRTGGSREGAFVTPTVLIDMPHDSDLWRHEVFGPVVMMEPWDDVTSAIEAANDADTGLQAGVFTQDIDQALDVAERLRVGAVLINSSSDFRIDAMPFGGFKSSGVGREGVTSAVESFSEPKVVAIRRAARA
ncbi:acyl-CoA reductase-like NAD-dependent aldehyde dehydrogenase [Kribbella sp. VKM Ac-2527]|uniref:Acyl-CoA reductase-like NAD-dependent aldehyde dehydrogenase n=1 Tax=Kribbella caucasensis TaxID=2512215 RepID=A0A4R6KF95_9ACTN|nr:aldehyde dehydrogenase family protein [Kribbella sp. VKM Ac-2527]TDO48490.1 acyl-CoA reductase-like NAD-dependent aldehyde dehydrogenase [Kribbella sp. VKM Ac-2527]